MDKLLEAGNDKVSPLLLVPKIGKITHPAHENRGISDKRPIELAGNALQSSRKRLKIGPNSGSPLAAHIARQ